MGASATGIVGCVIVVACFGILWLVGSLLDLARLGLRPEEEVAYFPAAGALFLSAVVAIGVWLHLSNASISVALWALLAAAAGIRVGQRHRSRGEGHGTMRWYPAACTLAFAAIQFLYIAYPDPMELDPVRQMQRSGGLPIDCAIPFHVARFIVERIDPRTNILVAPEWYFSDRPPLSGLVYAAFRLMFGFGRYWGFVAVGTLLNALFLLPAFVMLRRLSGSDRAFRIFFVLSLASCFLSINAWFTWPKLLGGAFIMLSLDGIQARRPAWLSGAAAGMALLSHGTAAFSVPALLWFVARGSGRTAFQRVATFAGGVLVTYGPWLGYQHLYDPDRGRLIKMHVFGEMLPSNRTFWEAMRFYVATTGPRRILQIRLSNIVTPFTIGPFVRGIIEFLQGHFIVALRQWHDYSFVYVLGALNPLVVVVACVIAFRVWESKQASVLGRDWYDLLTLAGTTLFVCVTIFGMQGGTVNHQWAYAAVLAPLVAASRVLARLPRWPLVAFMLLVATLELAESYTALLVGINPPGWTPAFLPAVALTAIAILLNLPGPLPCESA